MINISSYSQSKEVNKVIDNTSNAIERVYADGTKVVNKAYEASSVIAPKIESALKSLGTELKVGANGVWNILIKQQLVWSICFLILTLSSIISWFFFYRNNFTFLKEGQYIKGIKKSPEYHTNNYGTNSIKGYIEEEILISNKVSSNPWFKYLHLIICLTLSTLSILNFSNMLTGFVNPEFGAMKTIATIASQIK